MNIRWIEVIKQVAANFRVPLPDRLANDLSPASGIVLGAEHPAWDSGGPCAGCAFRPGTEANSTGVTLTMACLSVEGLRPFYCHEHAGLCRGWTAAVNLRREPVSEGEKRWSKIAREVADVLGQAIAEANEEERVSP